VNDQLTAGASRRQPTARAHVTSSRNYTHNHAHTHARTHRDKDRRTDMAVNERALITTDRRLSRVVPHAKETHSSAS